jgi:predicted DCC family thiol-disulfide oxidoreductase YuxK
MTPALREQARKAVQVITADGQQLSAGRAILFALEATHWHPSAVRLAGHRPAIWLVELGYWIVARNRSFFGRLLFRSEGSDRDSAM